MRIRDAAAADAAGITDIYNDAVLHSTATWNTTTVDADDRRAWIDGKRRRGEPVLVAVDGAAVLGYATFGPWRDWDGYRHTVENSIYVRADRRGAGTGAALMAELVERARGLGVHIIVAGIDAGNEGSIRFHERFGFRRVGLLPEVGTKFGAWLDLAFLQLALDDRADIAPSTS